MTVIICAYTERRWDQLRAAVESAAGQRPAAAQLLLVIDHSAALAARARRELAGLTVLDSDGPKGLSGARNAGLRAATEPVAAFLDDDAQARPGWLAALVAAYDQDGVVATGGAVYPRWPGQRPAWMPPAFDWVVGCSYTGLPDRPGPVRNPIGANMSMRTGPALAAGGFDSAVGRVGTNPTGCEETELSIRMTAARPGSVVWYAPGAAVDHHVAPERARLRYFLRRCWHEGRSKALVVERAGPAAGLNAEWRQAALVIPLSVGRDLAALIRGDGAAGQRAAAALAGLATTSAGYLSGRAELARARFLRGGGQG
ncbi:MAG: glycosyltransferase family 2 protein [Streptosporangiaceae bacterium]